MKGSTLLRPQPNRPEKPLVRGCEAKRFYITREVASAHALLLPSTSQVGLRPYLCPECEGWHLGHHRWVQTP